MVIQRIQTLYLLLVTVLMAVFMFVPSVWGGSVFSLTSFSDVMCITKVTLGALCVIVPLLAVFKFKNLHFQKSLCSIMLVLILTLGIVKYLGDCHHCDEHCTGCFNWIGLCILLISFILVFLARKAIKHDHKLLSDSRRIR